MARIVSVLLVARLLVPLSGQGQQPRPAEYWPNLSAGPVPVGFTQNWLIDSTRRLPGGDSLGLRYRPVLLNLWYPTSRGSGSPMPYRDYFDGAVRAATGTPALTRYATMMDRYQRTLVEREVLRMPRDSAPAAVIQRYDRLWSMATPARRDAPRDRPVRGVVIYTQGAQASFDDNVVLAEFLASHGWAVIGSAWPAEDGASLATRSADESRQRDIRRLLLEAARLGLPTDWVAVVGHSAGAQAMLLFATDPSAPIDAILALDTTQDYATLADSTWLYMTERVVAERAGVGLPIAFAANRGALFELADSLAGSDRWLVTPVGEIGHNDFIAQGHLRRQVHGGAATDSVAARYAALLRFTSDWLDAVRDDRGGPVATNSLLEVTRVPRGERFPALAGEVRTGRELRHLFASGATERFVAEVLRLRGQGNPAAATQPLMMLITGAIAAGDGPRARDAFARLLAGDPGVRAVLERITDRANLFRRIGATDLAARWDRFAEALQGTSVP